MTGQEFLDGLKDIVYKAELPFEDYLDGYIYEDTKLLIDQWEYEEEIE